MHTIWRPYSRVRLQRAACFVPMVVALACSNSDMGHDDVIGGSAGMSGVTGGGPANAGASGVMANAGWKNDGGSATGGAATMGGSSPLGGGSFAGGAGTGAGGGAGAPGIAGASGMSMGGGAGAGGAAMSLCPGASQTLTVGGGEQYPTVQAAVAAVPSNNAKLVQIHLKPGTYDEQVVIDKPFVCLTGDSAMTTIISHKVGSDPKVGGAVLVSGNDFSAANITFQNTLGLGTPGGQNQAVALKATGKRQQFRDCRFLSYQDTLYTSSGTQYFRDCFIQGSVDYIFGEATAVFEACTMNNAAEGSAVAAPRTPQNAPFGIVFLGGSLTANPTTTTVRDNRVHLGRPWGPYAAAAYLKVKMEAHIATAGWTIMGDSTLADTHFWEYKSTGPGANPNDPKRASRQLTDEQAANYTVAKILAPWTPEYSR